MTDCDLFCQLSDTAHHNESNYYAVKQIIDDFGRNSQAIERDLKEMATLRSSLPYQECNESYQNGCESTQDASKANNKPLKPDDLPYLRPIQEKNDYGIHQFFKPADQQLPDRTGGVLSTKRDEDLNNEICANLAPYLGAYSQKI